MTSTTIEPAATPGSASLWEDFVDIFFAPSEVFARRRDGRFVPALVVLTIVSTILAYAFYSALSSAFAADFARGIAQAGAAAEQMPVETMQAMSRNVTVFGSLVMVPLGIFVSGLIAWFISKLFDARLTVGLAVTIATYAAFPRIFSMVSGILQGILLNPESMSGVSAGPARFLDPDSTSTALIALLSRVDLFVIWCAILMGIGFQVIGGMRRTNAFIAAGVVWLLASVPLAIPAIIAALNAS